MKNILVLSFACSPVLGSEFSVGWNFINHMNKHNRLFVLYADLADNTGMDDYISGRKKIENVSFFYCGKKEKLPKNVNVLRDYIQSYRDTKKLHNNAFLLAKEIIERERIDCIHYLNPIGFKESSTLWKLNLPYVWGPVQTVSDWPWFSLPYLSLRGKIEFFARKFFHNIHFYCNKNVRKAFYRSDVVVAATPFSKDQVEKSFNKKVLYSPENAIESIENYNVIEYKGGVLQILFAGSLIDRKGVIFILYALNELKKKNLLSKCHLHVFGTGYLENTLKEFTRKNHLDSAISWHGFVDRGLLQRQMRNMHLNVITSLSEGTPTTLWESMLQGVPTLYFNHCGMQGVLNEKCGFPVEVSRFSCRKNITSIVQNLSLIIEKPEIIREKSMNLKVVLEKHEWQKREIFFDNVYDYAICEHNYRND